MILENYQKVCERIAMAARSAGRDPGEVRLVVVTKGHGLDVVREVVAAGASRLGENYLEEAEPKIHALSSESGVEWHMIGHVQSRKAQAVSELFACVHSLDRLKIARRFSRYAGQAGRSLPVLLECNVSGEESKYGFSAWQEEQWDRLLNDFGKVLALPNLEVRGLMTMAPFLPDAEDARPYFRRLRRLQAFLQEHLPQSGWSELSMGMSADYEVAIQEGATLVRIGTAILGPRPYT